MVADPPVADSLVADAQIGLDLKERGMAQARAARDVQKWREDFRAAAVYLASTGSPFTSEDVIGLVGLPREDAELNANNAVGAMMNALARADVIIKTYERRQSMRATSHGREIAVWIGK